jgi:hypothetical protein
MKTTILYHVVFSDDISSKQVVNNEGEFIECLVKLKYAGRYVIDDVVGKAKYVEKYRNKIIDW